MQCNQNNTGKCVASGYEHNVDERFDKDQMCLAGSDI